MKKFASRGVADADPRPRALVSRAPSRGGVSLTRPDARGRVSRAGGPTRARLARARRGVVAARARCAHPYDDAVGRPSRSTRVASRHALSLCLSSLPRPSSRARVRPTRRRVSIGAPRRANARWRRAAGARRVVAPRRPSRTRRATGSVGRFFFFAHASLSRNGVARARTPRVAARRRLARIHTESRITPRDARVVARDLESVASRSRRVGRRSRGNSNRHASRSIRFETIRFVVTPRPDPASTRARPRAIETDVFSLLCAFSSPRPPPTRRGRRVPAPRSRKPSFENHRDAGARAVSVFARGTTETHRDARTDRGYM